MKSLKIIDILVKKANGTLEDGFEFKFVSYNEYQDEEIEYMYKYDKKTDRIVDGNYKDIGAEFKLEKILNYEVQLIEENKGIEELETAGCNIKLGDTFIPTESIINDMMIDKINELVRAVNKLTKE